MGVILYGIRTCDTVRRARTWLTANGIDHAFHDHRRAGVDPARLAAWADAAGWEALLNRAGTTLRALPEVDSAGLDRSRALALMLAHPACIRRPVVEHERGLLVGFDPRRWQAALA